MPATRVWFNLHTRTWSVAYGKGRVRHFEAVALSGVTFKVSESGRLRVVARKCREVHAHCAGAVLEGTPRPPEAVQVSYNPYRGPTFYRKDNGEAVHTAACVWFEPDGKAYATLED